MVAELIILSILQAFYFNLRKLRKLQEFSKLAKIRKKLRKLQENAEERLDVGAQYVCMFEQISS